MGGSKHFTITPFNKESIIKHLRDISKGTVVAGEVYYSDAVGDSFIPGKRVKSFKVKDRNTFEKRKRKSMLRTQRHA